MDWDALFRFYPASCRPSVAPVPVSQGLSGARVWRVDTPSGRWILRRHASHFPDDARLDWLHNTLQQLHQSGWGSIPLPVRTCRKTTWCRHEGYRWELVAEIAGSSEWTERSQLETLWEACRQLARFHRAAARVERVPPGELCDCASPPRCIVRRIEWLDNYVIQQDQLVCRIAALPRVEWRDAGEAAVDRLEREFAEVRRGLVSLAGRPWPRQIVLRDVRAADVFFRGGEFSGFVDFTSLGCDTPAADLARLVGTTHWRSLHWSDAISAYESEGVRLRAGPGDLARLDQATHLCAMLNWLVWSVIERRSFAPHDVAFGRIAELLARPGISP